MKYASMSGPGAPARFLARVTNLVFTRTGSQVVLTWAAAANATSYIVEAGSASGLSNIVVIDTGNAATQLTATAPPWDLLRQGARQERLWSWGDLESSRHHGELKPRPPGCASPHAEIAGH